MKKTLTQKKLASILEEARRADRAGADYLSIDCPECGRRRLEPVEVDGAVAAKCEKCRWPYIETDDEKERRAGECAFDCECLACYMSAQQVPRRLPSPPPPRPDLFAMVAERLEAGRIEYGDKSAREKSFAELVMEIREEVADVLGWFAQIRRKLELLGIDMPAGVAKQEEALKAVSVAAWDVLDELEDELRDRPVCPVPIRSTATPDGAMTYRDAVRRGIDALSELWVAQKLCATWRRRWRAHLRGGYATENLRLLADSHLRRERNNARRRVENAERVADAAVKKLEEIRT